MQALYSKFGTVHKEIIHLNGWQQRCARRPRILANLHATIDDMKKCTMKYKEAPLHMPKLMRASVVKLKACIRSQSGTVKISRSSSLAYMLPMHEYSRVWMLWCAHMRSHHLGLSSWWRQRNRSNLSLTHTSTSWCTSMFLVQPPWRQ